MAPQDFLEHRDAVPVDVARPGILATKYRQLEIAASVAVYLVVVSLIPIWNKKVFKTLNGDAGFHYPLTLTVLQLSGVAVMITVYSVGKHFLWDGHRSEVSWIFGSHFLFKLRKTFAIGVLFGLKYGISNWGLDLIDTPTHLLLTATDLVWSCLFAYLLNGERIKSWVGGVAVVLAVAGAVLISVRSAGLFTKGAAALPLAVNLASPVLLGLCISTLRKAAKDLLVDEASPVRHTMTSLELTGIKLWLSALAALPFCIAFEQFNALGRTPTSASSALADAKPLLWMGIYVGAFFILLFQTNITYLAKLTSAITVGIVGGVKVLPQWLASVIFIGHLDLSWLNLLGAALVLLASVVWTASEAGVQAPWYSARSLDKVLLENPVADVDVEARGTQEALSPGRSLAPAA